MVSPLSSKYTNQLPIIGQAGQSIDALFAGPFHREFGDLHLLLKAQLHDKNLKRKWNDDVTPELEKFFKEVGFDYKFDKIENLYNKIDFINKSGTNYETINIDIIMYNSMEKR